MARSQTKNARGPFDPATRFAYVLAGCGAVSRCAGSRFHRAAQRRPAVLRDHAVGNDGRALARARRSGAARARHRERPMALTVLNVAYPLSPAGPDAVGGAEQVLTLLDAALVEGGHCSIVLACEGSQTRGELVSVPRRKGPLDANVVCRAREQHARAIGELLGCRNIDLVHLHGVDFHTYLPAPGIPVLATLHLPPDWYPREALDPARPDTWLQCVSARQHASCGHNPKLVAPIENGVPVGPFRPSAKRNFALVLSRICPEKGVHVAIDAAKRAGIGLLIAGEVYAYADHERYFRCELAPRLDRWRRFI